MSGKTRSLFLSLTIIAVIVFSAFGTTRAYADGGTTSDPPPTETTTGSEEATAEATASVEQPAAEVENPTEVSAEATAVPEESSAEAATTTEATVDGASTPEVAPTEDSTEASSTDAAPATEEAAPATDAAPETAEAAPATDAAPATEATVLDAVPDNTTVTVLDANGQEQPLATEAAAEAIATSDPMWCPSGVAPFGAGCTPSFGSFTALLNELSTNSTAYQGAGTIYVQQGAYTGGESVIDFNNYNLTNISGANLTVLGGWDGTANPSGNPANPSTFTNTSIMIGGPGANMWGGSLTLMNLTLNNPGLTGLALYSQQNVRLTNVDVNRSSDDAGADIHAGGNVTIEDSNFTENKTAGARINAGGFVTVTNSTFSNPETARRQNIGLDIQTSLGVSLSDVVANENRLAGANLNSSGFVSILRGFFSGTKEMLGSGDTTTFMGYGLQVVTPGTVDLSGVTANNNFLWGANIQAGGDIAIADSIFNANTTESPGFIDDTGLFITGGGAVDLTSVTANDNRLYGAKIDADGPVSIHNSEFSNNRGVITTGGTTTYNGHGLQVTSLASISLDGVTATNNMLFGAQLNAGGDVGIGFSTFSNTSTGSSANALGKGLEVTSPGNVSLNDVTLNNNQTVGADIRAGGNVTLTNLTANNNGGDGVFVQGACATVTGGTFTGNGGMGLNLDGTPVCVVPLLGAGNTSLGSSNTFVFLSTQQNVSTTGIAVTGVSSATSASVTLKNVVSKSSAGSTGQIFFAGKYTYTYSNAGLQIFALSPALKEVAMRGAFRAY